MKRLIKCETIVNALSIPKTMQIKSFFDINSFMAYSFKRSDNLKEKKIILNLKLELAMAFLKAKGSKNQSRFTK